MSTKMPNVWQVIDDHLIRKPPLKTERFPTFYPSSASCVSEIDKQSIGSCIRESFYRCAGYEKSDKDSVYSQYIFASGNIWEQWVINQFKESGLYLGSNIKFVDVDKYISGEVDIVIKNPEDLAEKIILEHKTFYGYDAKTEIMGNTYTPPRPKDNNLLQAFLYLGHFAGQISKVMLLYMARDDNARNQFMIEVHEENGKRYPKITTIWQKGTNDDKIYSYIDKRITLEGIYGRYEELMEHLKNSTIPDGDFRHTYTDVEIKARFESGEVSKTAYEKWTKTKDNESMGHYMCRRYCGYRTMCKAQKDQDKHL